MKFDLRKDLLPERRPQIMVKLKFTELRDSKLSGSCTFDSNIISESKNEVKSGRQAVSGWDNDLEVILESLTENSSFVTI